MGGTPTDAVEENTGVWVTDLPSATVPPTKIQRWGHDQWDLENRGFNELVNLWHMDHYFIHNLNAIETLLLTLAMAFLTDSLAIRQSLDHLDRSPPEKPPPDIRDVVRVPVDEEGREIEVQPA